MIAIWVLTVGVFFGGFVLIISVLISASAQAYLVGTVKTSVALRQAGRQFLPCFVNSLLFGLIAILSATASGILFQMLYESLGGDSLQLWIFGDLLMLILIWVLGCSVTYWCFFASTILVERESIRTSLRRCRDLIRGAWWRTTGMVIAIFLFSFTISSILRAVLGFLLMLTGIADVGFIKIARMGLWDIPIGHRGMSITQVLMSLVNLSVDTLTMPIWVIGGTLLYFDQRIRKEGFDIEMMATRQGV